MNYTFKLSALIICTLLSASANAQQYQVSGTIENKDGQSIVAVNVSLLNHSDSSWVQTDISKDDGAYAFEKVEAGKYLVATNAIGYKPMYKDLTVLGDVSDFKIVLETQSNNLDQVVVRTRRNIIRTELGKTILDIGDNAKQGKNVLDVLRELPGVEVSPTGGVSIQGKTGLVVLINDKPTYLEGEELTTYLRGVSAADIKNIELMTQPSAKYDAEGNVGLININMTRKKKQGWSGNMMARHSQSNYGVSASNATINYKRNNVTVYASLGTYFGQNSLLRLTKVTSKDPTTGVVNTTVDEDAFMKETYDDYNLKLGVDIDLNDKTSFGSYVKGVYHTNSEVDHTKTLIVDNVNDNRTVNIANGNTGDTRTLWYGNAYLDHKLLDGHKLSSQLDFFRTDKDIYQRIATTNHDKYGSPLPDRVLLENDIPTLSDLYSAKVDYTGNVGKYELEAGVKSSYVWIDDENIFYVSKNGRMQYDSSISNHFVYNESISAAYISGSRTYGKWQTKAGVRAEQSYIKGKEYVQGSSFIRDRLSFFPSLFVNYKLDSNNTVELNYGRRVKRPFYRELNPFRRFESQYRYTSGNPYLQPQYAHNFELKHNYKNRLISTGSYNYTSNLFASVLDYNEQTKVSNYSTTNNGHSQSVDLSMYLNLPIIQEWLLVSTGRWWYVNNYSRDERNEGWGYSLSVDSQFTFNKGWYANVQVGYTSRIKQNTVSDVAPSVWSSANVSKRMFNDSGTLKLSLNDPFNVYRYRPTIMSGNSVSEASYAFSSSSAILSFTYNFGKNDRKSRNTSTDELNRM